MPYRQLVPQRRGQGQLQGAQRKGQQRRGQQSQTGLKRMPLEVGAGKVLDGENGMLPLAKECRGTGRAQSADTNPTAGGGVSHLGGPLGGVLHHRLAEAIIHVGRHLPLRGAPGPLQTLAGLPAQRHCPRQTSPGAGPGRRQHDGSVQPRAALLLAACCPQTRTQRLTARQRSGTVADRAGPGGPSYF